MKLLRRKIFVILALYVALFQPIAMTVAYAGPLSNYLGSARSKGLFSQSTTGLFTNEDSGYRGVIGGTFIFPGEVIPKVGAGFSFDFSASCMGMDFNAEAFANLKMSQVIDWLKQMLISAGFTYIIALATASPQIKNALDSARNIGQKYSDLLQSPCEIGSLLTNDGNKKGFGAMADCVQTGLSNLGSASTKTAYSDCIAKKPLPKKADKSTQKDALQVCTNQFGITTIEKKMLKEIIGGTGWTRSKAGIADIKGIKPLDPVKDYQALYDSKVKKFTVVINKLINVAPGQKAVITATERAEMFGPGMSIYAKDIRSLRLVSLENISNTPGYIKALAEAMTLGEFKYAILKLTELLVKCQAVDEMPESVKQSMKEVSKNLVDFITGLDRSVTTNSTASKDNTSGLYKRADKIIKNRSKTQTIVRQAYGK